MKNIIPPRAIYIAIGIVIIISILFTYIGGNTNYYIISNIGMPEFAIQELRDILFRQIP